MYTTAVKSAAETRESVEPVKLLKRIGSATVTIRTVAKYVLKNKAEFIERVRVLAVEYLDAPSL